MDLTYIGPHAEVEVPLDGGSSIVVARGASADFPADVAKGLLEQGKDSAEESPQHQPQWEKTKAGAKANADETEKGGES